MDTLYIILAVVILFVLFNKFMTRGIKIISTADLKSMMKEKTSDRSYIDVRTPGEFKSRKIKGFMNIPLDQLDSRIGQINQDHTVVVICQSGSRSAAAARKLKKAGFNDILNVRGGMTMWRD